MGSKLMMLRCTDDSGMAKVKKAIARLELEVEITSDGGRDWAVNHHDTVDAKTASACRKIVEGLVDLYTKP